MESAVKFWRNNCFFFLMLLVLPSANFLSAQTTITPQKLPFNKMCANAGFNTFDVRFTTAGFAASATFRVQLSGVTGSFTTPIETTLLNTKTNAPNDLTITFAVPVSLVGSETYHLRVISSTGVVSSDFISATNVKTIPGYYKVQDSQFTINNSNQFATFCSGGSAVLSIDNPGTGTNDSPLKYPSLSYNWFKEPSLTPIATTTSLSVNQPGIYYVETNYGSCNPSSSYSNRVTVNAASGTVATLTSSLGNPFCGSQGATTLSTQIGNTYVWKKDGTVIPGVNTNTYLTSQPGLYTVDVDFGGCVSNAAIDLKDIQFAGSLNVPDSSTIKEGETKSIIVTTDAISPSFQWFRNNVLIPNETANTYLAVSEGDYKVVVTQNSSCVALLELPFELEYPFVDPNVIRIPNLISPNGDGINDTWILPQEYCSGSDTEVKILNYLGDEVLRTNDYLNNWPESQIDFKNINPVYYYIISTKDNQVKKGSITVVK